MLKKLVQTLFTINEPIGRLTYFKYCMAIFVSFLLFIYLSTLVFPYLVYFLLVILFIVNFVISTKRAWDIIGEKTPAIMVIILYVVCILFSKKILILKVIKCILGLVLLFTKGRITSKQPSVDNNTQENIENLKEG